VFLSYFRHCPAERSHDPTTIWEFNERIPELLYPTAGYRHLISKIVLMNKIRVFKLYQTGKTIQERFSFFWNGKRSVD